MNVQSANAPLYLDSDYQNELRRSAPALAAKPKDSSGYKTYDSFSHSYVLSTTERSSSNGTWYPWSQAHLLIWLAKHCFSWTWQTAVKDLNIAGAEFLLRARTAPSVLFRALMVKVVSNEARIGLQQDASSMKELGAELSRLRSLIAKEFGPPGGNGSDAFASEPLPTAGVPSQPTEAQPSEPSSDEAFWRTLCMDVIDCSVFQRHRRCAEPDERRVQEWLDWIEGHSHVESGNGIPQLHWHLNVILQKKRMITTNADRLGLVSEDVLPGDKICIFAGEAYPYVLRPVTESNLQYRLVCPAYIHGIMDGEALRIAGGQANLDSIYIV